MSTISVLCGRCGAEQRARVRTVAGLRVFTFHCLYCFRSTRSFILESFDETIPGEAVWAEHQNWAEQRAADQAEERQFEWYCEQIRLKEDNGLD